jgi:integrase
LVAEAGDTARKRRPSSRHGGHGAEENALNALRFFFNRAVDAGYRVDNPAGRLKRPARRENARRGLEPDELRDVFQAAVTGGDAPDLDGLLIRTAVECGARREGLINLTLADIDRRWCRLRLDEKFGVARWVPITAELADAVISHAHGRGASRTTD